MLQGIAYERDNDCIVYVSGRRHFYMIMLAATVMMYRLYAYVDVFMCQTYMEKDCCQMILSSNCNSSAYLGRVNTQHAFGGMYRQSLSCVQQ